MDDLADRISVIDITDASGFALVPPCADPGFDHRSCDYWEDADRGSKAIRLDWLASAAATPDAGAPERPVVPSNPFLADLEASRRPPANPFLIAADDDAGPDVAINPFAPTPVARPTVGDAAPKKLRLLGRGLGVTGSFAKVLLLDGGPAVYCQFGPLTAYPRAQRTRDLYPALPSAPLPAVITCIATTRTARGLGLARRLVETVCDDLSARGFAAVETYPATGDREDATSGATPAFWISAGFAVAAPDDRFPVMRRDLA